MRRWLMPAVALALVAAGATGCGRDHAMKAEAAPAAFVKPFAGDAPHVPLLEGPPQTCGMRSGRVLLKQGEDCGEHTTGAHEECLVVLEGRGEARVQGRAPMKVEAGSAVYVPPHTTHCVYNVDCPVLRYVYVVAPVTARGVASEPHAH